MKLKLKHKKFKRNNNNHVNNDELSSTSSTSSKLSTLSELSEISNNHHKSSSKSDNEDTTDDTTLTRYHSLPVLKKINDNNNEISHRTRKISISHDKGLDKDYDPVATLEKPPNIDFYRMTLQKNLRPSMPELMHGKSSTIINLQDNSRNPSYASKLDDCISIEDLKVKKETKNMNWFNGVYIPSFTNIVGTLLYIRMGYVVGQAGILAGCGVVLFSTFVITITALSLTGICSNGQPKKGGLYYVVSRALGPQLGGCIGVIFSIANFGMAALYIVGIAEFSLDLLKENGYKFAYLTDYLSENRILSLGICIILMLITFAGPQIENSFTLFFFSTYYLSYFNWIIGSFLPTTYNENIRGVTGYSLITAKQNLWPNYRGDENIVTVFAVFFPGFTGMMAATMYVDQLEDPGKNVGKGLFSCIWSTATMYLIGAIVAGFTIMRDADGINPPIIDNVTNLWKQPDCVEDVSCKYGLMNYHQVAEIQSAWVPLTILGMFGMTISSTMTNLDQGPLIFQAICKDKLFPYLHYFSKEYGPNKEPRRAYVFFAILTMSLCLIGDLNMLNFVVTNMFMVTYALVNYACFDASFAKSPGWRPTFPYYNMWVSLFGSIMCVVIMFAISIAYSILTVIVFILTMAYFHYYKPEVNWGDSNQAHLYRNALTSLNKLTTTEIHVKNYRPQILLMIGNPASRIPLLDFANSITKGESLLLAAHVIPYPVNDSFLNSQAKLTTYIEHWLKVNKIKAFYTSVANKHTRSGCQNLLQTSGLGKLRPNVMMVGFKERWRFFNRNEINEIDDYVGILHDAFESNFGVGIIRSGDDGFDHSDELLELLKDKSDVEINIDNDDEIIDAYMNIRRNSNSNLNNNDYITNINKQLYKFYSDKWIFDDNNKNNNCNNIKLSNLLTSINDNNQQNINHLKEINSNVKNVVFNFESDNEDDGEDDDINNVKNDYKNRKNKIEEIKIKLSNQMNRFYKKKKKGIIDVWWLYDDGGLTLLIPHLLRLPKSYLEGSELRIFTLSTSQAMIEADEENMIAMLTKFRIEFSAVKIINDITKKPNKSTIDEFEDIIKNWKTTNNDESKLGFITEKSLISQKHRTMRQLRAKELLQLHSKNSDLIVITLPIPRVDIPSCLYMAWLDVMTKDLPPTLMIRGNQTSVLSFYL